MDFSKHNILCNNLKLCLDGLIKLWIHTTLFQKTWIFCFGETSNAPIAENKIVVYSISTNFVLFSRFLDKPVRAFCPATKQTCLVGAENFE